MIAGSLKSEPVFCVEIKRARCLAVRSRFKLIKPFCNLILLQECPRPAGYALFHRQPVQ